MPLQRDKTLLDYYDSTYGTYNDSYDELQEDDDEERVEAYRPDPDKIYKKFNTSKFKRKEVEE